MKQLQCRNIFLLLYTIYYISCIIFGDVDDLKNCQLSRGRNINTLEFILQLLNS